MSDYITKDCMAHPAWQARASRASPQAPTGFDPSRENMARALHAAYAPFADYSYAWDDPLSSQDMFYALADAALRASRCEQCDMPAVEDGLCREHWDEIHGRFGVGA